MCWYKKLRPKHLSFSIVTIHHYGSNFNPLPDGKFYSFKLKEFKDHNFKFDENGRLFAKRVKIIVGKGEIARYERLVFQGFQKVTCGNG